MAELISGAARSDAAFARELGQLVELAQHGRAAGVFVANTYDNAKSVNINGTSYGPIDLG